MKKPADTDFPLHEPIRQRWSPVSFDPQPLSSTQLGSLLEAARWAPSCYNGQPWHFIFGHRGTQAFDGLASCLVPGNLEWAASASVLMLCVARLNFRHNGKPNGFAQHDVGLAVGQMLVQATFMGLIGHPMAGYDLDKARTVLGIPDDHAPMAMIAIGFPGSDADLTEQLKARQHAPRERIPLAEMVSEGFWGNGADLNPTD